MKLEFFDKQYILFVGGVFGRTSSCGNPVYSQILIALIKTKSNCNLFKKENKHLNVKFKVYPKYLQVYELFPIWFYFNLM